MKCRNSVVACVAFAVALVISGDMPASGQSAGGKLILYGDVVYFQGRGLPENCTAKSRYKRGEPVGFRMAAVDAAGALVESAEMVVHVTFGGKTVDVPMRLRPNQTGPAFFIAKWIVPADAPTGVVRYVVTGKDKEGRTGEFKPFANELSQLAIVE